MTRSLQNFHLIQVLKFCFIALSTLQTILIGTGFARKLDRRNRTRHRQAQETPDFDQDIHAYPEIQSDSKVRTTRTMPTVLTPETEVVQQEYSSVREFLHSVVPSETNYKATGIYTFTTSENLCHTSHSHRVCCSQHTSYSLQNFRPIPSVDVHNIASSIAAQTEARTQDNAKHSYSRNRSPTAGRQFGSGIPGLRDSIRNKT